METFSALLALCAKNSSVTGEFPSQRPVTRSFEIFFDLRPNERLNKQPKTSDLRRRLYGAIVMAIKYHTLNINKTSISGLNLIQPHTSGKFRGNKALHIYAKCVAQFHGLTTSRRCYSCCFMIWLFHTERYTNSKHYLVTHMYWNIHLICKFVFWIK